MAGKLALRMTIVGMAFACVAVARAADNDGDGVPDGVDVCCNTPPGVTVDAQGRPIGDLDLDCDVDLMDFAIFVSNLTGPLAPVACADCMDGQQNGNETDIDCGGGDCPPCLDGQDCQVAVDCESLVCQGGICTSSCSDGIENGNETDTDCGGGTCPACANGFGCLAGSDCESTLCQGGLCVALPNGAGCSFSGQCASGFCVDGVCCNSACGALCADCDLPGSSGTCTLIPNGQDPDNECSGATTCNGAGGCTSLLNNGSACTLGSQCLSGQCVDGVCCNSSCSGICQRCSLPGSVGTCTVIPNGQDPDNECSGATTCNGAGGCTSLLNNGSACTLGSQCLSGQCVDGVCCNSSCAGVCQRCNLAGTLGTCTNILNGQDPDNECTGSAVCNGSGACTP